MKPLAKDWPTFNGDYSGKRYSSLSQINRTNVGSLTLAWVMQLKSVALKSMPLVVNGIMYFTIPDKVWAIDARTGHELWNYTWTSKGGIHLGNRGVGISGNSLYFETPDCNLVSLNLADGKKRWNQAGKSAGRRMRRIRSASSRLGDRKSVPSGSQ